MLGLNLIQQVKNKRDKMITCFNILTFHLKQNSPLLVSVGALVGPIISEHQCQFCPSWQLKDNEDI